MHIKDKCPARAKNRRHSLQFTCGLASCGRHYTTLHALRTHMKKKCQIHFEIAENDQEFDNSLSADINVSTPSSVEIDLSGEIAKTLTIVKT